MLRDFFACKGDGEPGFKTIWLGVQRVMDGVAGLQLMCEDGPGKLCLKKWFMGIYRNRSSHSLKLSKDHINNLLFVRPER